MTLLPVYPQEKYEVLYCEAKQPEQDSDLQISEEISEVRSYMAGTRYLTLTVEPSLRMIICLLVPGN